MLSIVRTRIGIPINDIFFSHNPETFEHAGWVSFFIQATHPIEGFYPFKTQIIDLRADSGAVFSGISSGARYKIKRAEREGVCGEFQDSPSDKDIREFSLFFDQFAQQKNLPKSNYNKLKALQAQNSLILSAVKDPSGRALARHAYVADRDSVRLRLLYSASHFRGLRDTEQRNMIGRANRWLHWFEMQEAKQRGYHRYDLGGIPVDDSNPAKNDIARFKRELGGSEILEYNGFHSRHAIIRHTLPLISKVKR